MRQGFEKLGLSDQPTTQSQRMNIHTNARLTLRSREALVSAIINRKLTAQEAAAAFAVSERTVRKWVARFRTEGAAGLRDHTAAPVRSHQPKSQSCCHCAGCACPAFKSHARPPFPKRASRASCVAITSTASLCSIHLRQHA